MISFDLKSGYHHIDINLHAQTFLGFAWKQPGDNSHITSSLFCSLFYCLMYAARLSYLKCLKPLEKYWRSLGTNIALCLDDEWLTESSYDKCMDLAPKIRVDIDNVDIKNAALVANKQKSIWQPYVKKKNDWLGLVWNSIAGTVSIAGSWLMHIFFSKEYY